MDITMGPDIMSEFDNYLQKIDRYAVFLQYWIIFASAILISIFFVDALWYDVIAWIVLVGSLIFHAVVFRNMIFMLFDRTEAIFNVIATFIPVVGFLIVLYNIDECKTRLAKSGYHFKPLRMHNYKEDF
jgi:hypothetical protein